MAGENIRWRGILSDNRATSLHSETRDNDIQANTPNHRAGRMYGRAEDIYSREIGSDRPEMSIDTREIGANIQEIAIYITEIDANRRESDANIQEIGITFQETTSKMQKTAPNMKEMTENRAKTGLNIGKCGRQSLSGERISPHFLPT